MSKIEWTDETWNPLTGCTKVSPGCKNCYAERMSKRLAGRAGYPKDDPFRVTLHEDKLEAPHRWRKPRKVFVCSMGDLFHDDVPDETLDRIFLTMFESPDHVFQILTKRPERMRAYIGEDVVRPKNIWLGVSIEDQATADERIPILLDTQTALRFVSCEPLLGPVDLSYWMVPERYRRNWGKPLLDWVICGGETGPGARPMHPDWPWDLRDQCSAAGIPFFFKSPGEYVWRETWGASTGRPKHIFDDGVFVERVGKKAAGRLLDGVIHEEWPELPE